MGARHQDRGRLTIGHNFEFDFTPLLLPGGNTSLSHGMYMELVRTSHM
jgi:hypothetical protein